MRVIAKIQLSAPGKSGDTDEQTIAILQRWAAAKFAVGAAGAVSIRNSGLDAQWETATESIGDSRLYRMCVLEPVDCGNLQLDVDLAVWADVAPFAACCGSGPTRASPPRRSTYERRVSFAR